MLGFCLDPNELKETNSPSYFGIRFNFEPLLWHESRWGQNNCVRCLLRCNLQSSPMGTFANWKLWHLTQTPVCNTFSVSGFKMLSLYTLIKQTATTRVLEFRTLWQQLQKTLTGRGFLNIYTVYRFIYLFINWERLFPPVRPLVLWARTGPLLIIQPPKRNPATDSERLSVMFQPLEVSVDSLCSPDGTKFTWSKGLQKDSLTIT